MKHYFMYHARGFSNEYLVLYADGVSDLQRARLYESECRARGGNPVFYYVTRKTADAALRKFGCTIENAENIRCRLPELFK